MNRKIVVTGMGVISPLGESPADFYSNLIDGRSGIGITDHFDVSDFKSQKCFQVSNFSPGNYITQFRLKTTQRITQFAVAASKNAIEDGGINPSNVGQMGLVVGSAFSGTSFKAELKKSLCADMPVSPKIAANAVSSEPSGKICLELGIVGHTSILSSMSTSALSAISYAVSLIKTGKAKQVLVVGAEELSCLEYEAFDDVNLLATNDNGVGEESRPFDEKRNGFVLGEGAGAILLETDDYARQRGANIYAEIPACCLLNNATRKISQVLSTTMETALYETNLHYTDIDYVCAGANSSILGDKQEVVALENTFRSHCNRLLISSIKSMTGEAWSASGIFSIIASILAMKQNVLPDNDYLTLNKTTFDLNFVTQKNKYQNHIEHTLVNCYDIFGNYGSIILKNLSY